MDEKPAFAMGFDEETPPRLVHFLDQQAPLLRLFLKETARPPRAHVRMAEVPDPVCRAIVERWDRSGNLSDRILWVFKDPSHESLIDQAVGGKIGVHKALGYPDCCAEAYRGDQAARIELYYEKLRKEHGATSDAEVLELIRKNVPVTACPPGAERAIQTVSRFPYIPFIACHACLVERNSEASQQNSRYRRMIAALDPMAARTILVLAKTMAHYGDRIYG
jgi:hypothetical protein